MARLYLAVSRPDDRVRVRGPATRELGWLFPIFSLIAAVVVLLAVWRMAHALAWDLPRGTIALASAAGVVPSLEIRLFDSFYRSGALVFGGGHVVLPGPLFTFAALPWWNALRTRAWARSALRGVNAAVVGLLFSALVGIARDLASTFV